MGFAWGSISVESLLFRPVGCDRRRVLANLVQVFTAFCKLLLDTLLILSNLGRS